MRKNIKARHDGLVAQRGETNRSGPGRATSASGVQADIFLDMMRLTQPWKWKKHRKTREATIAWETRQLGIMDWITNDVDWMTKEVHPSSVRLAWHN